MKIFRLVGAVFMSSLFFSVSMASYSAIIDINAGMASDIVKSNNVVQVYHYDGASSESGLQGSTFDEGEDWSTPYAQYSNWNTSNNRPYVKPVRTSTSIQFTQQLNSGVTQAVTSDYVKTIDACTDAGNYWIYNSDTCIQG